MIKEVIVVEGKNDANKLKSIFKGLQVIITNGSEINMDTIKLLVELSKTKGVILFLDPDGPGKIIRGKIQQHIKNAKHAFIKKSDGISKNKKKVGIEHATREVIIKALENVYTTEDANNNIQLSDLVDLNLVGSPSSKDLRIKLSNKLNLGFPNAKQLLIRLNLFNIQLEVLTSTIKEINNE